MDRGDIRETATKQLWLVNNNFLFKSNQPTAMASIRCLHQWTVNCCSRFEVSTSKQTTPTTPTQIQIQQPPILISRRWAVALISSTLPFCLSPPSEARERRNKKTIPLEDYLTARLLLSLSLSLLFF